MSLLQSWFPRLKSPPIAVAPMRLVTGPALTAAVANAGGLAFLGAGWDFSNLPTLLQQTLTLLRPPPPPTSPLPIGVGMLTCRGGLDLALAAVVEYKPAAVWLFGAGGPSELQEWVSRFRDCCGGWLRVFVQVGSPEEARAAVGFGADALVVQGGADAGGHGLMDERGSWVVLVPEVRDVLAAMGRADVPVLAAGGIVDGRGVAGALGVGADGAVVGSRFVLADESDASRGLKEYVRGIKSGPRTTVRTRLYDELRGTAQWWPEQYGGRAIRNASMKEHEEGVDVETLTDRYREAEKAEDFDRLTVFMGTGVGMINTIEPAATILENARAQALARISQIAHLHNAL